MALATRAGAQERIESLLDPGSFEPLRSAVRSGALGERARAGDGVLAGCGCVDGRPLCCYAQEGAFLGGSLGAAGAGTLVELYRYARRALLPVVGFIDSAGARLQEGLPALAGYGALFRAQVSASGLLPQIAILCGNAAGGSAYSPALCDFVVMSEQAAMFLTGPGVVAAVTGESVDAEALGGLLVHARNGTAHLYAAGCDHASELARALLSHLPSSARSPLPCRAPAPPAAGDPGALVPSDPRRVYDMRALARTLLDRGELLEISPRHARNLLCALGFLAGIPVGVIASQPRYLGGVLDGASGSKGARFVRTCSAYGLPLIVLVDTPGFLPGARQEREGVIRQGAKLLHAFAEARVPRLTVIIRKAFGGAYIAMNCKTLGADRVFAWPTAQIGVMGAQQALPFLHRRELAGSAEPELARAVLAARYEREQLSAQRALECGLVDELIAPDQTRERLTRVLTPLVGAARPRPRIRNIPL
ncbi:MAG TPA: carboxyl transferase domain-containing protein [Solirubrobacteraceae bacterium]|nr:carboxyl transferase domain-containing protein [Solirubrobacteraceae bacterium]